MVSFSALCEFSKNVHKTHVVELDFFQIFLPYSFRLIGPQTKHSQIQLDLQSLYGLLCTAVLIG
jgi:hypothetical protein